MTVSTTGSIVAYTGDAVSTTFAVTFSFFDDEDLQVISRVIATGVETVLTLTTNYTVTGGDGTTGAIVMGVAPAATVTITIRRVTELTQDTDLSSFGPFPAQSVEEMADRLTMIAQENERDGTRTLLLPVTESSLLLPNSIDRAGKYLSFDGSGNPVTAATVEVGSVTFSPFGESLVDDANAATARTTLGIVQTCWGGTTGGTANARTLTPAIPLTAYTDGLAVVFRSNQTNSGASTVNISGLGVEAILDKFGAAIPAGSMTTGLRLMVYYNGDFYLMNESGAPSYEVMSFGGGQIVIQESGDDAQIQLNGTDAYLLHNVTDDRLEAWVQAALAPWRVGSGVLTDDTVSMAQGWHRLESYTVAAAPAQKDFVLTTYIARGYKRFMLDWRNLSPAAAALLMARFSVDAGSTFKTAGGDYGNSWWLWNAAGTLQGGSGVGYVQLSATVNVQTAANHAAGSSGTMEFESDRSGLIIAATRNRWMAAGPLLEGVVGQANTTFAGPIDAVRIGFVSQNMENFGSIHLLGSAS